MVLLARFSSHARASSPRMVSFFISIAGWGTIYNFLRRGKSRGARGSFLRKLSTYSLHIEIPLLRVNWRSKIETKKKVKDVGKSTR